MLREPRALLFDLDDTLHPRRRFVISGLRAVAAHAAARHGIATSAAAGVLARALRHRPGHELQALQEALALPPEVITTWIGVLRAHVPALRLSAATRDVLTRLRADWRLGLVTNGLADVQARKVAALDLPALVEAIVYATADGRPGKPAAAPFLEACTRLAVTPARTVFVGDDLAADIAGAAAVGMKTIWLAPPDRRGAGGPYADITVHTIADVPAAARRLLPSWWSPYAA
ncbi:MAG: HAD family hydrolase [Vicinamibacterales bacterium]